MNEYQVTPKCGPRGITTISVKADFPAVITGLERTYLREPRISSRKLNIAGFLGEKAAAGTIHSIYDARKCSYLACI